MKTKLVVHIIAAILLFGCKEDRQIEIIPNLEQDYLSETEVDKAAELKSNTDDAIKKVDENLINAIKSIHDSSIQDSLRYIVKLRIYINEDGWIDKIKDISTAYDRTDYSTDGVRNYLEREKMNKALSKKLAEFEFEPAVKDGKNVKSHIDLTGFNILAKPDGNFEIEMPEFLSGMSFSTKDKYLIAADVMPEIVGGLYAIQSKIVYPETAKRSGIQGKVFVLAFIDENGDVKEAKIIKGIGGGCDEAAMNAVKQVKFIPGKQEGKPVKVQVTIPILFKLQ